MTGAGLGALPALDSLHVSRPWPRSDCSHAVRLAQEGADIIVVDLCEQIPTSPA
jgi:hypothetical protein